MQKAIIGKKVGMTQIFDESGKVIPVTVVEAGPCVVTQKKTVETDGYVCRPAGLWRRRREEAQQAGGRPPEEGRRCPQEVPEGVQAGRRCRHERRRRSQGGHLRCRRHRSTLPASAKATAIRASVKRHGAGRTPMTHGGGPVHRHAGSMGAIFSISPVSSRARSAPARWAMSRSPSRIWTL